MVSSNIGIDSLGASINNGAATLELNIFDYPKLTIASYGAASLGGIGSRLGVGGQSFYLESMSIDSAPINPGNFTSLTTYSYAHSSKLIYELALNLKDFLNEYKDEAVEQTKDSYIFNIGTLISFAKSKTTAGGVSSPSFTFKVSKKVSPEETVTLKQYIDDRSKSLGLVYKFSGSSISFTSPGGGAGSRPVQNYNIGKNSISTYKDTILQWDKNQDYEDKSQISKKKYVQLTTDDYTLYDGDYQPHLPPTNTLGGKVPKDLSIMVDNSGETKQFKLTKYKFGKPERELSGVFGYAHAAVELVTDPAKPNNSSELVLKLMKPGVQSSKNAYAAVLKSLKASKFGFPDDANFSQEIVWRLISIKETEYQYVPIKIKPAIYLKYPDGTKKPATINPEALARLQSNNYQVLKKEISKGWEIKRFAQEDPSNWTQGSISAWLNLDALIKTEDKILGSNPSKKTKELYFWMLYQAKTNLEQYLYRKIPFFEEINYAVDSYTKYYTDSENIDWEIQYIAKKDLYGASNNAQDEEIVPIIFPDPNWQPELMTTSRNRYKSSVAESGNPQYNPFARDYYGSNPSTVVTGSEEYELNKYNILPSKNTKATISNLYSRYAVVSDIIAGISQTINTGGTVYTNHKYVFSNDEGLNAAKPPKINPGSVASDYPVKKTDSEDLYTIITTNRNAQDHSYKSNSTQTSYTISEGRPPAATMRRALFEEVKSDDVKDNPLKDSLTYITSSIQGNGTEQSVYVVGANNVEEAIKGAGNKLMLEILNSGSSATATLSFNHSSIGLINGGAALPGGSWVIKRATLSTQYSNGQAFGQLPQVECGLVISPGISSRTVPILDEETEENNNDSLSGAIEIEDLPDFFTILPGDVPIDFGRWVNSGS